MSGTDREYAVKAETHDGSIMTLRRGFVSREDAEDHPVKASLWKRVWVESVGELKNGPSGEPALPPGPWNWVASGGADIRGQFHIYLVDANGKKLAAIWGKEGQKTLVAQHIIQLVNGDAAAKGSQP